MYNSLVCKKLLPLFSFAEYNEVKMLTFYLNMIDECGDRDLFERLYEDYRSKMYYAAMGVLHNQQDAEDALHNAFLSIAKNIDKVSSLEQDESAAYLFRAAKNAALNLYAKKKKRDEYEISVENYAPFENISDDELIRKSEDLQTEEIANCLESLPEHYRVVLDLHFRHGYSVKQTANALGINTSTVKQRLVRGKKILLEKLGEVKK